MLPGTKSESIADTLRVPGSEPAPSTPMQPTARPLLNHLYSQDRQPSFGFTDGETASNKGAVEEMANDKEAAQEMADDKEAVQEMKDDSPPKKEPFQENKAAVKAESKETQDAKCRQDLQGAIKESNGIGKSQQTKQESNGKDKRENDEATDVSECETPDAQQPVAYDARGRPLAISAIPVQGDTKAEAPPRNDLSLSRSAIDKRLRRVFTPRTDGSFKVPARFVEEYKKKGTARKSLEKILASCGYSTDWLSGILQCLCSCYGARVASNIHCLQEEFTQELHEIAETYFEDELIIEGEFMTEQAMLNDGLTESLDFNNYFAALLLLCMCLKKPFL